MKDTAEAEEKKNSKYQISAEELLADLPGHIYWKDKDGVVLGCNDEQARSLGFKNGNDVIGKTDYDFSDKEVADICRRNDLEAMTSDKAVIVEEPMIKNGVRYIGLSKKIPLKNKNNEIIGVKGVSLDITDKIKQAKAQKEEENKVHYTASLTNIPAEEKDFLKSKSCVLEISVGQEYHEGEKLRASLEMINNYFKSCLIAVCDTLQRHTLSILHPEKTDAELYNVSLQLGSEWIKRNEQVIKEELKIPYQIVRWDHWFKNSRFAEDYSKIQRLYTEDSHYKSVLYLELEEVAMRFKKRAVNFDMINCFKYSKQYLLEECAVMLQWFSDGYDYDVYPSMRNKVVSSAFDLLEPKKSKSLLKTGGITFKKNTNKKHNLNFNDLAFGAVVSTMPGNIYWKDKYGITHGCNLSNANNVGFAEPESLVGKTDFDMFDYDTALEIRKNDLQIMRSGKTKIVEEKITVNGKDSVYISHKSPIKDSNGAAIGILGVSVDITKQKELEDKLETKVEELNCAIQARDVFLRSVSHEVRTPLSCILRMSNFLYDNWDGYKDNEERKKHLKMAVDGNNRLEKVLVNLLDLSKVKAGRMEYDKRLYSLDQSIKDVVGEFVEHKHRVKFDFQGFDCFEAVYDSLRIEQVIRNLLDNALKYGGSGHIDIMLSQRGDHLLFGIGDQGVGVPQSEREAIFDIFTQSSRTRTGAGGTGIGLSIAKSILEDHGGKIWVECKKESGSIFWFTLPRVIKESNTQQNTAALEPVVGSAPARENKKPLLLVIDDDSSILNMSSLLLASLGFEVITADCGEAGFKVLQQRAKEIDVVLLDVMMPDIYGINLLQKIKADERIKSIPIYMHSGMSDQSEIERAMTLGATGFIEKTVGLAKIKETLKDFLYVDAE